MSDTINVACCVFPDGKTFWTDDVENGPRKAVAAWQQILSEDQKREYTEACVSCGIVIVRMLRRDYIAIGASNDPVTMAYVAQG